MLNLKKETLGQSLSVRANNILDSCDNIIISNDASYSVADHKVSETASLEKGILEYWAEPKASAHRAWKSLCAKEKEMLEPIQKGSKLLAQKMADYKRAFDEAEKKRWEDLQEEARKEARLQAFELAEQGVDPKAVEAVMQMADENVPMTPRAELRGKTSFGQSYEVRLIQGESWKISRDILEPTTPAQIKAIEAKVKAQAKLNGGKQVEGFEIIPIDTTRRRAI
tara:strand:- start:702 stop:1376 length:675 start_codon:yes stop_codon:yes gene_type:complete